MVASHAVNMTIRSPRFFIAARSQSRNFPGTRVIEPTFNILSISTVLVSCNRRASAIFNHYFAGRSVQLRFELDVRLAQLDVPLARQV